MTKNPAAFDPDKLDHIDGEHFKRLDAMKRVALVYAKLEEEGLLPPDFRPREWAGNGGAGRRRRGGQNGIERPSRGTATRLPRLAFILKVMGSRIRNLKDAPEKLAYFYKDEYPVDERGRGEAPVEHGGSRHAPRGARRTSRGARIVRTRRRSRR